MQAGKSLKKINAKFSMIQCSFMMSFSAIVGFSVVLLQSRNFKSSEIGIILAVECVASVISQTFLGSFADKHKKIQHPESMIRGVGIFRTAKSAASAAGGLPPRYPRAFR